MVSAEKQSALEERMESLGIYEDDLVEKFVLGTGSGGQKINKTHSCVWLKHEPSGHEVKCQSGRSRAMNRYIARSQLCEMLEEERRQRKLRRQRAAAKARNRNRRPSAAARARMAAQKRHRSNTKRLRQKPSQDD
ncbi:MAG: peptide chain release factor-like protein [Verrucomicrobiota bacterium]